MTEDGRLFYSGPKKQLVKNNLENLLNKKSINVPSDTPCFFDVSTGNLGDKVFHQWNVIINNLMACNTYEFVSQIYKLLLEREASNAEVSLWRNMLHSGTPREVVLYLVYKSKEYGNRLAIKEIEKYSGLYKKYYIKKVIKKIPVLGWSINFLFVIRNTSHFRATQNMQNEDLLITIGRIERSLRDIKNELTETIELKYEAINTQCKNIESMIKIMNNKLTS